MNIVCAETVLAGTPAFQTLGTCTVLPDRAITSDHLQKTDALIVRSKTSINAELLTGTPVQFVGTATAGTDHLDIPWLEQHNIRWCAAPGCNANSVAEYITAALLTLTQTSPFTLHKKTIGIIGCGHVGQALIKKARALNLRILQNDPPLAAQNPTEKYYPLHTLLTEADIITLHTPLTHHGSWPTAHLANFPFFQELKPSALFINAARGGICDYDAWLHAHQQAHLTTSIIDVWDPEPHIRPDCIQQAQLATPHIAGHSFEGKFNGTLACYHALCQHLNHPHTWQPESHMPPPQHPHLEIDAATFSTEEALLHHIVQATYPIQRDDTALRALQPLDEIERAQQFDLLRKTYPLRREFNATTVHLRNATEATEHKIHALGFNLEL
ncbi:MAG: 4-phosphoerythronate dehydrogenase [Kiritimatiellaceae bacterium]|nr:MAG: 4-phosphoerythronate dehydrogenase [Kiritimatiellaceae bacterium]